MLQKDFLTKISKKAKILTFLSTTKKTQNYKIIYGAKT